MDDQVGGAAAGRESRRGLWRDTVGAMANAALRDKLVQAANSLDLDAAVFLLQLPEGPETDRLDPAAIGAWADSAQRSEGLEARHVCAALRARWLARQGDIPQQEGNAVAQSCLKLLMAQELEHPFLLEALAMLLGSMGARPEEVERLREKAVKAAAEPPAAVRDDPYLDACWRLLRVRQARPRNRRELLEGRAACERVAADMAGLGDRVGELDARYGLLNFDAALAEDPAARRSAMAGAYELAQEYGRAGNHLVKAKILHELALGLQGRQFRGPSSATADSLLFECRVAFLRAGFPRLAKLVRDVQQGKVQPRSLPGLAASAGALGLLIWAFAKGNDALLFLAFLGSAIMVHEIGHWVAAALVGIPIARFRIGVGTLLCGFRLGGTRVELCMVPFLGYVQPTSATRAWYDRWRASGRTAGRGADESGSTLLAAADLLEEEQPCSEFVSAPRRLGFFAGGLAANFLLAVLLIWGYGQARSAPTEGARPAPGPLAVAQRVVVGGYRFYSDLPRMFLGGGEKKPDEDRWIRKEVGRSFWSLLKIFGVTNCILLYFNLLPVPPLDGSQLMLAGAEAVTRRRLPPTTRGWVARVGYAVIALLIIVNIYQLLRDVLGSIAR